MSCDNVVVQNSCPARNLPLQLDKETTKKILIEANKRRFSKEVQVELNKFNNSRWFGVVVDTMHMKLLREMGYSGADLDEALDQVYSARWRFRNDPDMTEFFASLVHVQMDFTGDGPIQVGDPLVSVPLHQLDGTEIQFSSIYEKAQQASRPLVVFAGSWT